MGDLEMDADRRRLLQLVAQTSFRHEKEPVFRLASGKMSRYYVDCKQVISYPEARLLIGRLMFEIIREENFDAVGGMEIGAYPIAASVSDRIFQETGRSVRVFVVRKEPKGHGVGNLIAGDARRADKTLIVDDVITTGGSTIDAIRRARDAGLQVTHAIVIVDREEESGRQNIENLGVAVASLFTLSEVLKEAESQAPADTRPQQ
ncbi:MAG TPA: orotate phosphoribosyltransferase [Candidatus Binataceae bacterium]|nr:orotate phosphoribosyltransferase [Candidatus Binataceae bacterium]